MGLRHSVLNIMVQSGEIHRISYKLQDSFCGRAVNYRALLRKMTYKDEISGISKWMNKALYASSPLCIIGFWLLSCEWFTLVY